MPPVVAALLTLIGWFAVAMGWVALGRWMGRRRVAEEERGHSTVEGAVFALVGFLIAFSFSGAQGRLENRTAIVVDEANAIGTAYLRVDLLPVERRANMRRLFARYVDLRIEGGQRLPQEGVTNAPWQEASDLTRQIWNEANEGTRASAEGDRRLLLDALNTMFDQATRRSVATQVHLPVVVLAALGAMTSLALVLAGRSMTGPKPQWGYKVILAAVFAVVFTVLLDLDHPRSGLIRMSAADSAMTSVRDQIAASP